MQTRKHASGVLVLGLGLGLVVLGLAAYLISPGTATPPPRVYYASAGGDILFPHERHAGLTGGCADCHHQMLSEERATSCVTCHHAESFALTEWEEEEQGELHAELAGLEEDASCSGCHAHADLTQPVAPPARTGCAECHEVELAAVQAGHRCGACHAPAADEPGRACRACHGSGEGTARTCDDCHAGEGYTADMLPHTELRAIEGHSCLACHVATRHGTVMHATCNRCHLGLTRGTFFRRDPDDDAAVCQSCHLKH